MYQKETFDKIYTIVLPFICTIFITVDHCLSGPQLSGLCDSWVDEWEVPHPQEISTEKNPFWDY